MINLYRGLQSSYKPSIHGNGIYFATDTLKILHNGKSYSGVAITDFEEATLVTSSALNALNQNKADKENTYTKGETDSTFATKDEMQAEINRLTQENEQLRKMVYAAL